MSAKTHQISFGDPRVMKEFQASKKENKSPLIMFIVLNLVSIGFSISYAYLGSTGISFPSWGGPFLITMGTLGTVFSGISSIDIYKMKSNQPLPSDSKETKKIKLLRHTNRLISFALNLLGVIASTIYIYLGSQGSHFPSWGSSYLLTMGTLGSASIVGYIAFFIFTWNKALKLEAWEKISQQSPT